MRKYVILAMALSALLIPPVASAVMPSDAVKINKLPMIEFLDTTFTSPNVFKESAFQNTNFLHHVPM